MSDPRTKKAPPRPAPKAAANRRRRPPRRRWWRSGWLWAAVAVVAVVGVVIGVKASSGTQPAGSEATISPGQLAPDGAFTTAAGQQQSVAGLRGQPTLLWFVTTWCSSCQAGTQSMAGYINTLKADGVRVVELELYDDLGQSGPSITDFGHVLAGAAYTNPDWTFGAASEGLSLTYDPKSYLDIYYLLDAQGKVVYINSSPAATISSLLSQAARLT